MVATGDADAMVTGLTRSASVCLGDIRHAIGPAKGAIPFGLTLLVGMRGKTIFLADTLVNFRPDATELADIVVGAAAAARHLGHEPRVALLSHSTFGDPPHDRAVPMRDAVAILDQRKVDFEYDGEMSPDVALEPSIRAFYPFCRLTGDANVLVVPGLALGSHRGPSGPPSRRWHDDRSALDRYGKAGPGRSDGCLLQPDRRSRLSRCLPVRQPVGSHHRYTLRPDDAASEKPRWQARRSDEAAHRCAAGP